MGEHDHQPQNPALPDRGPAPLEVQGALVSVYRPGERVPRRRSLVTRLLLLFSCLVAVPLVVAGVLLTWVARNSVRSTGDEMTRISQQAYKTSSQQLIDLASRSSKESSRELMRIGNQQLRDLSASQTALNQKALRESGKKMADQAAETLRSSTDSMVELNRQVLQRSNLRLRELHLDAIHRVSDTLGRQAKQSLVESGRRFAKQNRDAMLSMVTRLNLERSRRIAERAAQYLNEEWILLASAAQRLADLRNAVGPSTGLKAAFDRQDRADWLQMALVDSSGEVTEVESGGHEPILTVGQRAASLPSYGAALRGNPQVSPVQFTPSREPYVILGVPVPYGGGRKPGVLFGCLRLKALQDLVESQSADHEGESPAFIATTAGEIIAHNDRSLVGRRIPPADRELLEAARRRLSGSLQYGEGEKARVLAAYSRLSKGSQWFAVALQPLDSVMRGVREAEEQAERVAAQAAREMEAVARREAARVVVESAPEQRQSTAEAAQRIRQENQRLMASAAASMREQQEAIMRRVMRQARGRSAKASDEALEAMGRHVQRALKDSDSRLRERATASAETGMQAMSALAAAAADRSAARMLGHSAWLLALFVAVALLVAAVTARSLVRPIRHLVAGTEAIASGDFSRRVPVDANDELGRLALAFNEMAAGIERSRYQLECSNRILEQEKSLIQAIVESSPDGMVLLDSADDIIFLNPAAVRLLAPEAGPVPPDALASNETVRQQVAHCVAAGPTSAQPRDVCLAGPPRRVLEVRFIPVTSIAGSSYGRLMHMRDVTREREIDEMKSNFVSLVSHELRTPLTSILGFSSYLLTGKLGALTDGQKTGLESVHRQANRLKAIISDFLDVSRIESGQIRMRMEPVRLAEVAARVLEDLRHQASEKRLTLRMDGVDITHPAVALGDEERITQVFTNLLSNAIKFTDPGGVITVSVRAVESGVEAKVSDTGAGIPEEELTRIFDRFYQVEKVVTRKTGGTGLGLAIVRNIVEAHGGEISVESRVGEGTTFTFTLPAPQPDDAGGRAESFRA